MLPGLTKREFQELLVSVGKTTRAIRPLSPLEVGELCAKAVANGATVKEITATLQMTDTGMVSKFLRLRELVPDIRHLVSWGYTGDGAIGFSVAAQLARMSADDQQLAADAVLKYRITRDEMTSVIQLLDRSGQSLKGCIERVVRRRPVVRLRQVILGAVASDRICKKLASRSQLERDALLSTIISSLFPDATNFAAKLGTERFAIIGGKSIAETVAVDKNLEENINCRLEEALT